MKTCNLSVLGLYKYQPDLFAEMVLPDSVGREDLINTVLLDTAELEVIYPNAEFAKSAIGMWSRTRLNAWKRMELALNNNYDPLANFDRHEEYEDIGKEDNKERREAIGTSTGEGNGTTERGNAGYNSSEYANNDKATTNSTDSQNSQSSVDSNSTKDNVLKHTGHLYGNIGTTKSQEMLLDEIEVRSLDLVKIISKEFKERFCILVY